MYIYTGIGSRNTPSEFINLFITIGKYFASKGFILRSGGAKGADDAFETGCIQGDGKKEIYLPWSGFENKYSPFDIPMKSAFDMASRYHPSWNSLSDGAKKLHARNCHQVLGLDLKTPTNFIVCWTPNGKGDGGTGQALRIAISHNIPIFDFGKYTDVKLATSQFIKFINEVYRNGKEK